jgi:hypothetical protein
LAYEVAHALEMRVTDMTSRPGSVSRHLAGAFLARSVALVDGIRVLELNDRGDVVGVLWRQVGEAVLLGLYVLLGGDDALDEIVGDHKRNAGIIVDRNAIDEARSVLDQWDFDTARLNMEQVAQRVGPLLQAQGDKDADASTLYDLLYRGESTFSVHGAGPALRYVTYSDEWGFNPRTRGRHNAARGRHSAGNALHAHPRLVRGARVRMGRPRSGAVPTSCEGHARSTPLTRSAASRWCSRSSRRARWIELRLQPKRLAIASRFGSSPRASAPVVDRNQNNTSDLGARARSRSSCGAG